MDRSIAARGIWASPNTQSLAISVFFHAALLAAPLLVSGLGYNSSPHVPRGDGAMAIDWVELSEAPSPPPVHPAKVVAHQARAAAESVVVPQKKEVGMAAETDAPTSELGSPSARVLTLGSPDGLSSEALRYHDELYLLFESRKTYPLAARRLNQQGEVLISMRIWANGKIDDQRVIKPSPYQRLNEAALAMVRQVRQFKPLPKDSGPYAYFQLPVEYSLN